MPGLEAPLSGRDTLAALVRGGTAELARAGVEGAAGDARRLMGAALGLTGAEMLARPERPLAPDEAERFHRFIARRLAREPVSRILGRREFYGRDFVISPATLDPRPDSETIVATALDLVAREGGRQAPLRIVDVGTGSGCLLLSLLCELPHATGIGTDISDAALAVARDNARRLGVAERAAWRMADLLEGVKGNFNLLVTNPPYVRSGDIPHLEPEVRSFDPHAALDGGPDGLAFYRRLATAIPTVIPDGWIVLEVGYDQADAVAALLQRPAAGIDRDSVVYGIDATGKRRCVACRTRK